MLVTFKSGYTPRLVYLITPFLVSICSYLRKIMSDIPEFTILDEVKAFQNDVELSTEAWHSRSMSGWHVTSKWADVFKKHLEILKPIAESGDAMAQYSVGSIYLGSMLYDNEEEAIASYEKDRVVMTKWLELAARQGVLAAIDNLIGVGLGVESDKLRVLYNEKITKPDTNIDEWKENMKLLYDSLYAEK